MNSGLIITDGIITQAVQVKIMPHGNPQPRVIILYIMFLSMIRVRFGH